MIIGVYKLSTNWLLPKQLTRSGNQSLRPVLEFRLILIKVYFALYNPEGQIKSSFALIFKLRWKWPRSVVRSGCKHHGIYSVGIKKYWIPEMNSLGWKHPWNCRFFTFGEIFTFGDWIPEEINPTSLTGLITFMQFGFDVSTNIFIEDENVKSCGQGGGCVISRETCYLPSHTSHGGPPSHPLHKSVDDIYSTVNTGTIVFLFHINNLHRTVVHLDN